MHALCRTRWYGCYRSGLNRYKGSNGKAVKTLQRLLRELNYVNTDGKTPIAIDGSYGSNTEAAVKRFQQRRGITVDGICGVTTWNKLLKG